MHSIPLSTVSTRAVSIRTGLLASTLFCVVLSACGGGGSSSGGDAGGAGASGASGDGTGTSPGAAVALTVNGAVDSAGNPVGASATATAVVANAADAPTTRQDAARFHDQAGFGPNEAQLAETMQRGPLKQLLVQFAEAASRYSDTLPANSARDQVHTTGTSDFCTRFANGTPARDNCWRDWFSSQPAIWDFYRQASSNRDQLRQRVAFTLGQIFVTSEYELSGSYGFAEYHQMLRDNAFGNFRTLLQKVIQSPFMGAYLNMVDNAGTDPNENFGRELLQLFSLGTCLLNSDGSLAGGKCMPVYDNTTVRAYAYALSGWTYPVGGATPWCPANKCDGWKNPQYFRGDMVPVAAQHDSNERTLLAGVKAPAGNSPQQGLNAVLDSIMAHPNVAPFICKQLIQHLVTSNPTPAYVGRVVSAFNSGVYASSSGSVGAGSKGDMQATLAAILLDSEARDGSVAAGTSYGKLKDPVITILSSIRALNGVTDGEYLGSWGASADMGQPLFSPPSVFNYYPPDFPLAGTSLVAPQFGISNANSALARINFANDLVYWWYNKNLGTTPNSTIPNATGTRVSYSNWEGLLLNAAQDSAKVVDRLSDVMTAGRLTPSEKQAIVSAMDTITPADDPWLTDPGTASTWQRERVKTAAYLILSSPQFQVQR